MEIDWFTFGAQVLNFLILVYLLRRFLYEPVTEAIDRREERIRDRREEAERQRREAEREAESYREERRGLEAAREEKLREAETEAEQLREELEEEAREEAAHSHDRWRRAMERQRDSLLRDLRDRIADHALATTRSLVQQLAGRELESEAVRTFARRLAELDEGEAGEFAEAVRRSDGEMGVYTRFELDADSRAALREAVEERLGPDLDLDFETSDGIVMGVELRAGDRKIAWSAGDRLDRAEREVSELLEADDDREEGP